MMIKNCFKIALATALAAAAVNGFAVSSTDLITQIALDSCPPRDGTCFKTVKADLTARKSRITDKFIKPKTQSESVAAIQCIAKHPKDNTAQDNCMLSLGFVVDQNK